MTICLVIDNITNVIVNRVVAEPDAPAPDGARLLLWAEDMVCDIGWTWNGTQFVAPVVEIVPPIEESN